MTKQGRSRSDGKRVADSISASGHVLPEASITYATQHMQTIGMQIRHTK